MRAEEIARHSPDEVLNQVPLLEDYNLWESDLPLREAVEREGGGWIAEQARDYGNPRE